MKTLIRTLAIILGLACVLSPFASAQTAGKKSYVFKGKVESVGSKSMTVANEKVEGWMEAMTMMYVVDKPEVLKNIKAGDYVQATVYDGDTKLYDVKVVPPPKK